MLTSEAEGRLLGGGRVGIGGGSSEGEGGNCRGELKGGALSGAEEMVKATSS